MISVTWTASIRREYLLCPQHRAGASAAEEGTAPAHGTTQAPLWIDSQSTTLPRFASLLFSESLSWLAPSAHI